MATLAIAEHAEGSEMASLAVTEQAKGSKVVISPGGSREVYAAHTHKMATAIAECAANSERIFETIGHRITGLQSTRLESRVCWD